MKNLVYHITFCLLAFCLKGEAQIALTNDFKFENGVYLQLENLTSNNPLCSWAGVKTEAHIDGDRYQIRLTDLTLTNGRIVKNDEIAAIVVDGEPFLNVNSMLDGHLLTPEEEQHPVLFVKLQVKGQLNYLYFEAFRKEIVPMNIFNPSTGALVRVHEVEEIKPVLLKKIIMLESGTVVDYELYNFLKLIKEQDHGLYKTLAELSEQEARNRLYKSLFIFNDRNPFYIKTNNQNN